MKKIFGVSALILFLIAISINSFNSAKKENNEEWNKEFGAEGTISFFVDGIVTDDGIVLLGRIYEKVWVVKIDKEGNEIWNRTFRRNLRVEEYGGSIAETEDGFVIGGYSGANYWIIKIDKEGNGRCKTTITNSYIIQPLYLFCCNAALLHN